MTDSPGRPTAKKRRRRTAESARREILDAAKNRLMNEGPDGLRLMTIAEDVGISHSSILHHFGSREGLLKALRDDAFGALGRDLKERLARPTQGDPAIDFFEKVAETLSEQGYGRLLAWQLMADQVPARASIGESVLGPDGSGGLLNGLATMLHEIRCEQARAKGRANPQIEETRRIVVMCACTMLGEAIAGEIFARSAGLSREPQARKEFRAWFAKQVQRIALSRPGSAPTSLAESVPESESDES